MYLDPRAIDILREMDIDPDTFTTESPAGKVLGQTVMTYSRHQAAAMDALAKLSVVTEQALAKARPELPGVDLVGEAMKHREAMTAMAALNEVLGACRVAYRQEQGITG